MAAPDLDQAPSPWAAHRRRAEILREQHPFAEEVLSVYTVLLGVWEDGWDRAREDPPEPPRLANWAAERVLPGVVEVTAATGPPPLASAARDLLAAGGLVESLAAWLAGDELPPVERYLARASLYAPLVALGADAGVACANDPSPRGGRRCPRCGGPPQLSFRSDAADRLVSGRRQLACARCGQTWSYSASTCPSCGETSGGRRTVYAERGEGPVVGRAGNGHEPVAGRDGGGQDPAGDAPMLPHLRIEACASCERYLIDIDLGRDNRAVPDVDELAAMPLDLYAAEHGLRKITTNLMGF
jgi:FdhE protein